MEDIEKMKGKTIKVLNHGFVRLVDWMGSDERIEDAARVSYGDGTRKTSDTRNLLRYLMRCRHTSPFEMGEITFQIKLPIFVMRQHIRHRTANVNEYSGRYSEMVDEFYVPVKSALKSQSTTNKQGGETNLPYHQSEHIIKMLDTVYQQTYDCYKLLLGKEAGTGYSMKKTVGFDDYEGLARELSRMVLPVANYTECYWKIDLHNMFHYLKLRMDPHAQYEIRVFADAMYELIKPLFPIACAAFEDYIRNAHTVSSMEYDILKTIVKSYISTGENELAVFGLVNENTRMGKREKAEFVQKWIGEK